jgi:hypothetical protein
MHGRKRPVSRQGGARVGRVLGQVHGLVEQVLQPGREGPGAVAGVAGHGELYRASGHPEFQEQGGDGFGVQVQLVDGAGVAGAQIHADMAGRQRGEARVRPPAVGAVR